MHVAGGRSVASFFVDGSLDSSCGISAWGCIALLGNCCRDLMLLDFVMCFSPREWRVRKISQSRFPEYVITKVFLLLVTTYLEEHPLLTYPY